MRTSIIKIFQVLVFVLQLDLTTNLYVKEGRSQLAIGNSFDTTMADPFTIVGALITIGEVGSTVIELIKCTKGASADRQKLQAEINATTNLCKILKDSKDIDDELWTQTFQALGENENGPVEQFRASLQFLHDRLAPKGSSRIRSLTRNIGWKFTREELDSGLTSIERQKSLFNLALTRDHLKLAIAIHDEIVKMGEDVEAIRIRLENQAYRDFMGRLSSIDYEATHADLSSRRANGTGQWFLQLEEFNSWHHSTESRTLWCSGNPGAG